MVIRQIEGFTGFEVTYSMQFNAVAFPEYYFHLDIGRWPDRGEEINKEPINEILI